MKRPASAKPSVKQPAAKRARSAASGSGPPSLRSGRGITNGFSDPQRNYAGPYPGEIKPQLAASKVTCRAGKKTFRPKRDVRSKELLFPDFPAFRPNLTPAETIKLGSFGGSYFRDIYSAPAGRVFVGEQAYKALPWKEWGWGDGVPIGFADGDVAVATNLPEKGAKNVGTNVKFSADEMLTSPAYDVRVNRFAVKCGGSLDMWESSGWINPTDPYGWFQWYCWFYLGRRTTDDQRQVQRWSNSAGPKGRFRNQLLNRCDAEGKRLTDARVSPVIRQTLQHWGLEIRPGMAKK